MENFYLNQKEIKEEINLLNDDLKNYFNQNYFNQNKDIIFDIEYSIIFLKNFKNNELKKEIYNKIINNYLKEIKIEKSIFGNYDIIKEKYSKEKLKNKKKLLVKELKIAKRKLKENSFHKKLITKIKNVTEEETFYLIEEYIKKYSKYDYYDKKELIIKYFNYLENKFKLNIDYNKNDLYKDSFEVTVNSYKIIKINFEITKFIGQASGIYSPSKKQITITIPKIFKKEKMLSLIDLHVFSHEFGHSVEDLFEDSITEIDKYERGEVISMYFENLISNEFIYEIVKDKNYIEIIKFKNIYKEFSLIYIILRLLKSKNKANINIKDKELKIYQGYLKANVLSYFLFHLKYNYVPFDLYFLGNYYSKIIKI